MYYSHFHLNEAPFNNTPDPRYFFSTPEHEEALATLIYGVSSYKGFLMLTGEVGAGKTLLSRILLRKFGDALTFANVCNTYLTPSELLEAVCHEFGLEVGPDPAAYRLSRILEEFLIDQFARAKPTVLVLDEAQNLSDEAFEQLRMIGNLEADDAKLLQVVIIGQPELRARFQQPQLRQLRQRIFRSFHLPALEAEHCQGYIQHRLRVAGHPDGDLFDAEAVQRVYEFSGGVPRLINTLCDSVLLSAYSEGAPVTAGLVDSVIGSMMDIEREAKDSATLEDAQLYVPHQIPHHPQRNEPAAESELKAEPSVKCVTGTSEAMNGATNQTVALDEHKDLPVPPELRSWAVLPSLPERGAECRRTELNERERGILNRLSSITSGIEQSRRWRAQRRSLRAGTRPSGTKPHGEGSSMNLSLRELADACQASLDRLRRVCDDAAPDGDEIEAAVTP